MDHEVAHNVRIAAYVCFKSTSAFGLGKIGYESKF